jgi:hypothetical protein
MGLPEHMVPKYSSDVYLCRHTIFQPGMGYSHEKHNNPEHVLKELFAYWIYRSTPENTPANTMALAMDALLCETFENTSLSDLAVHPSIVHINTHDQDSDLMESLRRSTYFGSTLKTQSPKCVKLLREKWKQKEECLGMELKVICEIKELQQLCSAYLHPTSDWLANQFD